MLLLAPSLLLLLPEFSPWVLQLPFQPKLAGGAEIELGQTRLLPRRPPPTCDWLVAYPLLFPSIDV